MKGAKRQWGWTATSRPRNRQGNCRDFSPYESSEDRESLGKVRTQSLRLGTQKANRSLSPFAICTSRPTSVLRPAAQSGFKKSLSLLVQLNKQETDDFLGSLQLNHRHVEPGARSIATTGRLREHKTHHRRSSEDVSMLVENSELKSEVQRLAQALQSAQRTITDLRGLIRTRDPQPSRRQSLPGEVPVPLLKLPPTGDCRGFHEEFMDNLPNFSQSWRDAIDSHH